jgi:hypothetical protein
MSLCNMARKFKTPRIIPGTSSAFQSSRMRRRSVWPSCVTSQAAGDTFHTLTRKAVTKINVGQQLRQPNKNLCNAAAPTTLFSPIVTLSAQHQQVRQMRKVLQLQLFLFRFLLILVSLLAFPHPI